jgi:2-isopropylmalate synthase
VFIKALSNGLDVSLDILKYSEHALGEGVEKQAVSYVQLKCNGERYSGVAIHGDMMSATLNAVLVAINQQQLYQQSKVA